MTNQWFAQNIEKGDLIAVPFNNYMAPAIFMNFGRAINFMCLWGWDKPDDDGGYKWKKDRLETGLKVGNDYVNRTQENVIVKVREEDVDPILWERYQEMKQLLKENGKL